MTGVSLAGQVVLVTGAAGTLGAAVCDTMRDADAKVVGVDLAAGDGIRACDVLDPRALEQLAADSPPFTHVVHAAGVVHCGPIASTPISDVERVLRVNLLSAFTLGQAMLPRLPAGGSFTVIASQAARHGAANWAAYSASKSGLARFVESAAKEFGPLGVRVNAVNPGSVEGPVMRHVAEVVAAERGLTVDEVWDGYQRANPLGGFIGARSVAEACLYLASSLASQVSGTSLDVDGGEAPG